jgi:anti-anti-sigma factor
MGWKTGLRCIRLGHMFHFYPYIDGGCLDSTIQVAPFFMALENTNMSNREHVMRWGFQVLPHAIILRMFGVVDQNVSEMFEEATERSAKHNSRQVVIDFSDIESIDAMGLVLCGFGLHHFRKLGIPVALVKPPNSLLPMLQEHGLPEVPPVFLEAPSVSRLN